MPLLPLLPPLHECYPATRSALENDSDLCEKEDTPESIPCLCFAGVNVYQTFDFIHHFTPKPVPPVEAVCAALAKNAVDIHPGEPHVRLRMLAGFCMYMFVYVWHVYPQKNVHVCM